MTDEPKSVRDFTPLERVFFASQCRLGKLAAMDKSDDDIVLGIQSDLIMAETFSRVSSFNPEARKAKTRAQAIQEIAKTVLGCELTYCPPEGRRGHQQRLKGSVQGCFCMFGF